MSRHNYSNYSRPNDKKPTTHVPTVPYVPVPAPEPVLVEESVETVTIAKAEGVVVNCGKLNVRAEPSIDADVVAVLNAQSEIEIDVVKSTDEWFHVCTAAGVDGYCMRKYVEAHL